MALSIAAAAAQQAGCTVSRRLQDRCTAAMAPRLATGQSLQRLTQAGLHFSKLAPLSNPSRFQRRNMHLDSSTTSCTPALSCSSR